MQRYIRLDVCDYNGTSLCNLYDSAQDVSGQAHDVYVRTERNGFKELRFEMPDALQDGERNYRIDYLISDYRIRLLVSKGNALETDWFLISESKVNHTAYESYEVRASHISHLLNVKNLDLEFSDEEGNNVGTIEQIARTILEGTGWHLGNVCKFYEEEKYGYQKEAIEKIRSFTAPIQTGAFKMMSDLCELFDAKPIYHGYGMYVEDGEEKYGRSVDIVPLNPFSKDLDEGAVPKDVLENEVIELHYDKNVKSITRTLNTDSMATRLFAYGSFGDRTGACSLQNATHYVLDLPAVTPGEYCFVWQDGKYFFTATENATGLKWSSLDFSSRSYVYNGTQLFRMYKEPKGSYTTLTPEVSLEKNHISYLMDFTYYDKVGLLSDEMLQIIADHQRTVPDLYIAANEASLDMSDAQAELSRIGSVDGGYLKLKILSSTTENGFVKLMLDKDEEHPDGVIYRSDYDESKRNYFRWNVATGIKISGEAIAGRGAIVYIIHKGSGLVSTKWEKSYVKFIGDGTSNYFTDNLGNNYVLKVTNGSSYESKSLFPNPGSTRILYIDNSTSKMYTFTVNGYTEVKGADYVYGINDFEEPSSLTLWTGENTWHSGDEVFLFSADSISGLLGPREDAASTVKKSIEEATKTSASAVYPIYFISDNDPIPDAAESRLRYGWYYHNNANVFHFGDLHFCWGENTENGDQNWENVYVSFLPSTPEKINAAGQEFQSYKYYYLCGEQRLYVKSSDKWVPLDKTKSNERLEAAFTAVVAGCINYEILTKGIREEYFHQPQYTLPVGNYAFRSEFENYWIFTTTKPITSSDELRYKYLDKVIWQDNTEDNIIKAVEHSFTVLDFPKADELVDVSFTENSYNETTGAVIPGTTHNVSSPITVYPNVQYEFSLPANAIVASYDINGRFLTSTRISPITTQSHTAKVKIIVPKGTSVFDSHYFRVSDYAHVLFSRDKMYRILTCTAEGNRLGLPYLMDEFIRLSSVVYEDKLSALQTAQQEIKNKNNLLTETLGDLVRDGYWREDKYTEGDEQKLYVDALDNLGEVSHPDAQYDVEFLDLYGSKPLTEDDESTPWPDIEMSYAAHLVDMDIDTNKWAYIDTLDKCYDQPWKTTMEINTRLSMIGQQSFTDVLTRIAEVANEVSANQSLYKRAAYLTSSGQMAAERLEGAINAGKLYILGGTSNWYTDNKGNIVFEAADGNSAMMLSGRGWCIANSKSQDGDWDWRYIATGLGLTADAIYTGYLSAERIEAGSITTDKLNASVGQELEIGSNKALTFYATTDGSRPSGSLITAHAQESDSWIAIGAKEGNNPAFINVSSGGVVSISGGSEVNISSGPNDESSTLNLSSGGALNVSGGTINITSSGKFLVDSTNFKINNNGDVTVIGNITTTGGTIAGFKIGSSGEDPSKIDFMYSGTNSITSTVPGIYIGTNGVNFGGGKFVVSSDGTTCKLATTANQITLGTTTPVTLEDTLAAIEKKAEEGTRTYVSTKSLLSGFKVGDIFKDTDSSYQYQYICKKKYDGNYNADTNFDDYWSLVGTSIIAGAALSLDAETGIINMVAANKITIASGGTIEIAANKKVSITTKGIIEIGNGQKPFTIGATNDRAYMYYGPSAIDDTAHGYGVYLGTDGIYIRGAANNEVSYIKATSSGTVDITGNITAKSGAIATWIISGDYIGNNGSRNSSTVGMRNTTDGIVFWAGGTYNGTGTNEPKFKVTASGDCTVTGKIDASRGYIGNWTIGNNYLGNAIDLNNSTIGLHYTTDTTEKIFWAGGKYSAVADADNEAPFYVKGDGEIKAYKGRVGGWRIGSTYIGNGVDRAHSTVGMYNPKEPQPSSVVFWAGGVHPVNTTTMPTFYVTYSGKLVASEAEIKGNSTFSGTMSADCLTSGTLNASNVTISNLSANSITGGTLSLGGTSNGKLEIKNDSNVVIGEWTKSGITMKNSSGTTIGTWTPSGISLAKGTIAGWTISGTGSVDEARLSCGTGTDFVALDAGSHYTKGDGTLGKVGYAIWCGSEDRTQAPFRVKRNGEVYITKLIIQDPDDPTKTKVIDLYTNFTEATSITHVASWSGGTYNVTIKKGQRTIDSWATSPTIGAEKVADRDEKTVTARAWMLADGSSSYSTETIIDATSCYNAGWLAARNSQATVGTCYRITAHNDDWVKVQEIGTGYTRVSGTPS